MTWTNLASTAYKSTMTDAIAAWNATSTPVTLSAVPADYTYRIRLFNNNDGLTGFDGVTSFPSCPGGVWSGMVSSHVNSFDTDSYDANGRKQVMVHKTGHAPGLNHTGGTACSSQPIMYTNSNRYFICQHVNPQADDVNGINYIY